MILSLLILIIKELKQIIGIYNGWISKGFQLRIYIILLPFLE